MNRGIGGITGHQGTAGPGGYIQIKNWKEQLMEKYPRFIIKTEYNHIRLDPTYVIVDNINNEEYKIENTTWYNQMDEIEQFIKQLIVTIRDEKINNLINE